MPKTDINKILKKGADTTIREIDYSSPEAKKKFKEMREECERIELRKRTSWRFLNSYIVK